MPENAPNSIDPTALPVGVAAKILSKAGGRLVTEEMLRNDINAGAPTNPEESLNLVHYAAWLIREQARGD